MERTLCVSRLVYNHEWRQCSQKKVLSFDFYTFGANTASLGTDRCCRLPLPTVSLYNQRLCTLETWCGDEYRQLYISHSLLLFHYHGRIRQYVYVYVWGVSWQCVQDMLLSWPKVTVEMEGSLRLWNEPKRKLKSAHFSSTTFHSDWSQTMMSDTSSSRLRSVYRQIPEIERFFLGGVYHMWCHKLHLSSYVQVACLLLREPSTEQLWTVVCLSLVDCFLRWCMFNQDGPSWQNSIPYLLITCPC